MDMLLGRYGYRSTNYPMVGKLDRWQDYGELNVYGMGKAAGKAWNDVYRLYDLYLMIEDKIMQGCWREKYWPAGRIALGTLNESWSGIWPAENGLHKKVPCGCRCKQQGWRKIVKGMDVDCMG